MGLFSIHDWRGKIRIFLLGLVLSDHKHSSSSQDLKHPQNSRISSQQTSTQLNSTQLNSTNSNPNPQPQLFQLDVSPKQPWHLPQSPRTHVVNSAKMTTNALLPSYGTLALETNHGTEIPQGWILLWHHKIAMLIPFSIQRCRFSRVFLMWHEVCFIVLLVCYILFANQNIDTSRVPGMSACPCMRHSPIHSPTTNYSPNQLI